MTSPPTITGECGFLLRHLDWLCSQPFVDEFEHELRQLLGVLRKLNKTTPPRPMTRCVVRYPEGLCGGRVWEQEVLRVVEHVNGHMTVGVPDGPAVCDVCGARWETDADKARLNLMIQQEHDEKVRPRTEDGRKMLTAAELAAEKGISVNAVRLKLSRLRVRASHGSYYDPDTLADVAS